MTKTDNYRDQDPGILVTKTQKYFLIIASKYVSVINLLFDIYIESWSHNYMRFEHKHVKSPNSNKKKYINLSMMKFCL